MLSAVATWRGGGTDKLQHTRRESSESQCQLWCQARGLKGFIGGSALNLFRKLLIRHVALPGSNPSFTEEERTRDRSRAGVIFKSAPTAPCAISPDWTHPVSRAEDHLISSN